MVVGHAVTGLSNCLPHIFVLLVRDFLFSCEHFEQEETETTERTPALCSLCFLLFRLRIGPYFSAINLSAHCPSFGRKIDGRKMNRESVFIRGLIWLRR